MKRIIITLLFPVFFISSVSSQVWQVDTAAGPSARYGHTMVQLGDKAYLFGGYNSKTKGVELSDLWIYDKKLDKWQATAPSVKPPARHSHSSAVSNKAGTEKIYIFFGEGGSVLLQDVWSYNPNDNTWTQAPSNSPPPARKEHTAVTLDDGRILIFGGLLQGGSYDNNTWLYDPSTGNWEQKKPFPDMFRYGQSANLIDGKVYFFGGVSYSGVVSSMWIYDPVADSWQEENQKSSVPPARSHYASVSYGSKMWIIGGKVKEPIELNDTWSYDVTTNTWTEGNDINLPASHLAACLVNTDLDTSIIIFGGLNATNSIDQSLFGIISKTTGISEFENSNLLAVTLVSSQKIKVNLPTSDQVMLSVFAINGQVLSKEILALPNGQSNINIGSANFPKGLYIVNLQSKNHGSATLKMMIGN